MRVVGILVLILAGGAVLAQEHGYAPEEIAAGAQLYEQNCTVCHGLDGNTVADVDLASGQFARATTDEELMAVILEGIPQTAMPPTALPAGQVRSIVAFLRTWDAVPPGEAPTFAGAAEPGDPARGVEIFEGSGQCLTCHWVAGRGSRLGPDLTTIGRERNAAYLARSLLEPNAEIAGDQQFILATTQNNEIITGRLLNHDTFSLQLMNEDERLVSLRKDDLRGFSFMNSPMPSYQDTLTDQELADLISYMLTLRGEEN